MDGDATKRWIKEEAARQGFALCGVAPVSGWASAEALGPWLEAGHHGTMAWMAREPERRADVTTRFPWAQSVVMVGMVYRGAEGMRADAGKRAISRYAWGDEYHDLLRERLRGLGAAIEAQVGPHERWHEVDTGPLLERAAAAAAGVGWLAKNTLLIHEREGSYLFLGALIVSLDLPPDRASPGRCGSCTRCLTACPTRAFPAPYLLDARRCVSYLTIEHRGPIPHDLREGIGEMVFGCDICQEVCPWNERAARRELPTSEAAFAARPGLAGGDLGLYVSLLSMDEATFRRRFRKSPVKRTKRRGIARNAAIALGNRGDPMAIPALARAAREDAEPLVRGHACWALGRLLAGGRGRAGRALAAEADDALQAARGDIDPTVRAEAEQAVDVAQAERGE